MFHGEHTAIGCVSHWVYTIKIYFINTRWRYRHLPWKAALRRLKAGSRSPFYAALTQALTGSEIVHCAVGQGDVVMEVRPDGVRFWPSIAYECKRGVSWMFTIPTDHLIDWTPWENDTRPRGCVASLVYYASRGLFRTSNCVTETKKALDQAGIDVPRRVLTPAQMWDWCRSEGYELSQVDDAATGRRHRTD